MFHGCCPFPAALQRSFHRLQERRGTNPILLTQRPPQRGCWRRQPEGRGALPNLLPGQGGSPAPAPRDAPRALCGSGRLQLLPGGVEAALEAALAPAEEPAAGTAGLPAHQHPGGEGGQQRPAHHPRPQRLQNHPRSGSRRDRDRRRLPLPPGRGRDPVKAAGTGRRSVCPRHGGGSLAGSGAARWGPAGGRGRYSL